MVYVVMSVYIWSTAMWSPEKRLSVYICFCGMERRWRLCVSGCFCCFRLTCLSGCLFWRELFVLFTVRVFRECVSFLCVIFSLLVLRLGYEIRLYYC